MLHPAGVMQVYFYLWKHHLVLLHGMVAEYIGRAIAVGMLDQQSRVYEKQLVCVRGWCSVCVSAQVDAVFCMQSRFSAYLTAAVNAHLTCTSSCGSVCGHRFEQAHRTLADARVAEVESGGAIHVEFCPTACPDPRERLPCRQRCS